MIRNTATADDFKRWAAHARTLPEDHLRYIVDDCRKASDSMKGWNPEREGFYADQAFTYSDELSRRLKRAA